MRRIFALPGAREVAVLLFLLCQAGCTSSLPRVEQTMQSPWSSFEEAKQAYDLVIPNQTTAQELQELGFDPYFSPNIRILNYLGVISRFMPNESITLAKLDNSVRRCIEAKQSCQAYEINPKRIVSQRTGDFLSDTLNFRRNTIETGWTFQALIVLHDNVVVYKLWGGTPVVDEVTNKRNPLGPLQSNEGMVRDSIAP